MQMGMVSTQTDPVPRLAVRLTDGKVLDVAASAEILSSARLSTSLKAHLQNRDSEATALEDLIGRVSEMAADEASSFLLDEAKIRIHAPISDPSKFLCVGKNYREHLDELARSDLIKELPDEPTGFIKLNSVIAGHGDSVARPHGIVEFDYEPELAYVIGKPAYRATRGQARDHVFGITLFNDLTAREVQRREARSGTRFWTAKNMPNFGPIGPWVVTLDEAGNIDDLDIECRVNGERRMRFNTGGQIFKIPDVIEHFSEYIPLEAGDLFATGSAAGVAVGQANAHELYLRPGDTVEVVLQDVMTLTNFIVEEGAAGTGAQSDGKLRVTV